MNLSLYDASIPTFIRMLQNLDRIIDKAATFAVEQGVAANTLLEQRLHPDMLPLSVQLDIILAGVKGSAGRLGGRLAPTEVSPEFAVFNRGGEQAFPERFTSFERPRALIEEALTYLNSFSRDEINAAASSIKVAKPGEARVFETHAFLFDYVLPNLYFHISVVYALLRSAAVPLGKKDFEGSSAYRIEP